MNLHTMQPWLIVVGLVVLAGATGFVSWLFLRRKPSPEELERSRRAYLVQSGRIVDGTLLDTCEVPAEDGRTLTMLLFQYRIGGVNYECSQDITDLLSVVNVDEVRGGFPCSVRYQPGNPQSSIVVAELWSGLRASLPQFPAIEDPAPLGVSPPGRR